MQYSYFPCQQIDISKSKNTTEWAIELENNIMIGFLVENGVTFILILEFSPDSNFEDT
jgi:hypothetical protein